MAALYDHPDLVALDRIERTAELSGDVQVAEASWPRPP